MTKQGMHGCAGIQVLHIGICVFIIIAAMTQVRMLRVLREVREYHWHASNVAIHGCKE